MIYFYKCKFQKSINPSNPTTSLFFCCQYKILYWKYPINISILKKEKTTFKSIICETSFSVSFLFEEDRRRKFFWQQDIWIRLLFDLIKLDLNISMESRNTYPLFWFLYFQRTAGTSEWIWRQVSYFCLDFKDMQQIVSSCFTCCRNVKYYSIISELGLL